MSVDLVERLEAAATDAERKFLYRIDDAVEHWQLVNPNGKEYAALLREAAQALRYQSAEVAGEVRELIAWLEDRAKPDSGLVYGDDSRGIAYATVHGYDAAFVAEHFHGKGAAHLAALLRAALSAQERG